ncbi:leucine-rich repeat protein [Ruminococcus sp. FC2018]|uniref:leucine-rich repeat protein n=1 Tax=Ruminococcus sp. FC2018 TaxID=1410617 RepID=UPI00048A65F4|nr:leucine-rich repeat protein [Ruminococcus sp. FC2018]
MKKTICMVIAALFAAVTLAFTAFADDTKYSHGYFYYHVHEGYVSICGYFGDEKSVEIPASIAGRPVSEIEHNAFKGCSCIEQIEVPDTIMYSYDDSFAGASSLKTISCKSAEVKIIAPKGVEVIYPGGKQSTKETAATKSTTAGTKQTAATTNKSSAAQKGTNPTSSSSGSVTVTTQSTTSQTKGISDSGYEDDSIPDTSTLDESKSDSSQSESSVGSDSSVSAKDSVSKAEESSTAEEKSSSAGSVIIIALACAAVAAAVIAMLTYKKKKG